MLLSRLTCEPGSLADFFQESLEHLGAVCERSWFDKLQLVAEGPAARLWQPDGQLHETELHFTGAGDTSPKNAATDVFPGCPLTFRLAETLIASGVTLERIVLKSTTKADAPSPEVAEKLWRSQWPGDRPWRLASAFRPAHHFSLLTLVRCETQAIDQHWSLHRLALSLPEGEPDDALAASLELSDWEASPPSNIPWPACDPLRIRQLVVDAMNRELTPALASVRVRQEAYLRRELDRIDAYFAEYSRELSDRARRARSEDGRQKTDQRLAATRAEHERRRQDQIQRHEIRVLPRIDALLIVAEPAWECAIHQGGRGDSAEISARFVPRLRRWFRIAP